MAPPPVGTFHQENAEADVTIWKEALFAADLLLLHASPVYYGLGIPRGDGSAVVLVPGFLGTDAYLIAMHSWLGRIGYRPYFSGIGLNAECPNLLIQQRLRENIDRALFDTEQKIHLIGHSLGGIIARAVASQRPDDVASVITLASPFRGTVVHPTVLAAADAVRKRILEEQGPKVLPTCYTGRCTCDFLSSLRRKLPAVGDGDRDLHPHRRHCRLALLHDRRCEERFRSAGNAHRFGIQFVGVCDHRAAAGAGARVG